LPGNAKILNSDTGNDLLTETNMTSYQFTWVCRWNTAQDRPLTSKESHWWFSSLHMHCLKYPQITSWRSSSQAYVHTL
jgi:hypothetical protein